MNASCLSYQIDPNPQNVFCWQQHSQDKLRPENLYNEIAGVVEYVKLNNCTGTFPVSTMSSLSSSSISSTLSSRSVPSTISRVATSLTTLSSSVSATGSPVSTTTRTTRPPTTSTAPMCSYNFTVTYNMNMGGGTETRWVTLADCQQACVANVRCIAVDVNPNPGQIYCYLIFNAVTLTSFPGVAHYDIYRGNNCPAPSSTTGASTSIATTPGTPTCVYKKLEGANADGGNPVGSNLLETQCLQLCNFNPACQSFEYAFATRTCFIHTTNDDSQNNPCCNRYVLQCSSSPCTDDFLLQAGYSPAMLQGYPQPGITSVDQCMSTCLNNPNCTRFFYLAQNARTQIYCYLYYTATDPVQPAQGVDLYIRQRCLNDVSITAATTTTTPVPTPPAGSCVVDLQFVIDSSGSIRDNAMPGVDNFELAKTFVKSVINSSFNYGVNLDHVGIVQFSDYARVVFDLSSSSTTPLSGLTQAIDDMPFLGAETNTGEGLRLGREMLANSSRPNALHFMILLTDGRVTPRWSDGFWTEIMKLDQTNIIRYGIGITNNVSVEELYEYAQNSKAIEFVDSYGSLADGISNAGLYINSFPCQKNIRPTTALTTTRTSSTRTTTTTPTSTATSTTTSKATTTTTTTTTTTPRTTTSTSTSTSTTTTTPTSTTATTTTPTSTTTTTPVTTTSTPTSTSTTTTTSTTTPTTTSTSTTTTTTTTPTTSTTTTTSTTPTTLTSTTTFPTSTSTSTSTSTTPTTSTSTTAFPTSTSTSTSTSTTPTTSTSTTAFPTSTSTSTSTSTTPTTSTSTTTFPTSTSTSTSTSTPTTSTSTTTFPTSTSTSTSTTTTTSAPTTNFPTTTRTTAATTFPTAATTSLPTTNFPTIARTLTVSRTTFAQNLGAEGVFGTFKNTSTPGAITTDFTGILANRFNLFNVTSDQFFPAYGSNEYFYTEICAGILQSTVNLLRIVGAFPSLSFEWLSTAQNDVDSGCRGGILAAAVGSTMSLFQAQRDGGLYSNEQLLTSWSVFSITDTMRYNSSLLSVYSTNIQSTPGLFQFASPYVNPTSPWMLYNAATTQYFCTPPVTAYFFSMSVGIAAGQTASVVLSVDGINFEMVRLGSTTTGITTLARSVLVPCSNHAVMTLSSGTVVPGNNNNLISFTAFPYERSSGLNSVSWAAYRTTNFTASATIVFDTWTVQQLVTMQGNSTITITRTGYYYVYISTGIHAQSTANLNLLRNSQILFGLRRRATNYNGIDTTGHGLVVLLNQTDVLQVQSVESGFSSATGRHASFFGMLLYDS